MRLLDERSPRLQLAVGETLDARIEAEPGLDAVHVDGGRVEAEPELAPEAVAVALGEHDGDVGDLAEDVEVGGQAGDRRRRGTRGS